MKSVLGIIGNAVGCKCIIANILMKIKSITAIVNGIIYECIIAGINEKKPLVIVKDRHVGDIGIAGIGVDARNTGINKGRIPQGEIADVYGASAYVEYTG